LSAGPQSHHVASAVAMVSSPYLEVSGFINVGPLAVWIASQTVDRGVGRYTEPHGRRTT